MLKGVISSTLARAPRATARGIRSRSRRGDVEHYALMSEMRSEPMLRIDLKRERDRRWLGDLLGDDDNDPRGRPFGVWIGHEARRRGRVDRQSDAHARRGIMLWAPTADASSTVSTCSVRSCAMREGAATDVWRPQHDRGQPLHRHAGRGMIRHTPRARTRARQSRAISSTTIASARLSHRAAP